MEFTKDIVIADVLQYAPDTEPLFKRIGMHCLGCAMASGETLGEACSVHGVNAEDFIKTLNAYVKATHAE